MGSLCGCLTKLVYWEVRRVKIPLTQRKLKDKNNAAVGIGTLIIFIAMILVAGIAASVIIQTINSLQQQALLTGEQTKKDISAGLKVTHVSGHKSGSTLDQIAIYIKPTAASDPVDLTYAYITLSNTSSVVILNYTTNSYAYSISNGLFGTLDAGDLSSSTYGIMEIRDVDNSSTSSSPVINSDDLIVILINTTACFSGIETRTEVSGRVVPEAGISGVISFTTPSAFIDTIIELQ
jgi:flagellin FlaB